jgi:hypothetical protein
LGGSPLAGLGLLPRLHEGFVTKRSVGVVEIVTFVVDHEVEDRAFREGRGLVDDQATVLHAGS